MKQKNEMNSPKHKKKSLKVRGVLLWGIMLLIVVIATLAVYYLLTKEDLTHRNKAELNTQHTQAGDGLPSEIFAYQGIVKDIQNDRITLMASKKGNYLKEDTQLIVLLNENTKYYGFTIPQRIEGYKKGGVLDTNYFQRTEINKNNLHTDDTITVISFKNIKNKKEFYADKIEKHNRL